MAYKQGTIRKEVSYSAEQWDTICKISEEMKLKTGIYIKLISLCCGDIHMADMREISALRLAINKFGVNINQVVGAVNSTKSVYATDVFTIQNNFEMLKESVIKHLDIYLNKPINFNDRTNWVCCPKCDYKFEVE